MASKAKSKVPAEVLQIGKGQMLRVKAVRDGHRRAGMAHTKAGTDHPGDTFSIEQIAALRADPDITLQVVDAAKAE